MEMKSFTPLLEVMLIFNLKGWY